MSEVKCYKIRNKEGLYSTGSMSPRWHKNGKTWSTRAAVMSHLTQFVSSNGKYIEKTYKDSDEIVEFVVSTVEGSSMNVHDELLRLQTNKKKREILKEEQQAKWKLEIAEKVFKKAQADLLKLKGDSK